MVTDSQFAVLQSEVETLRDRYAQGQADLSEVDAVTRMAYRLQEGVNHESKYVGAIKIIHRLLDAVRNTLVQQQKMYAAATELRASIELKGVC